jgi:hypothetical protein
MDLVMVRVHGAVRGHETLATHRAEEDSEHKERLRARSGEGAA